MINKRVKYMDGTVQGRVGCLVARFGFNSPFRQYFSPNRVSPTEREREREREGRKKRELIDKRKNVEPPPLAPTTSAAGPCPTIIQLSRMPWQWKFYPASSQHQTTPIAREENIFECTSMSFKFCAWYVTSSYLIHTLRHRPS